MSSIWPRKKINICKIKFPNLRELKHLCDWGVQKIYLQNVDFSVTYPLKGTGRSEGVLFYLQSSEHEFIIRD